MSKHIIKGHQEKICCETCGESFSQRSNLKRHGESAHKQVKKFQCEHCEASFGRKEKLNKHIKNHCNTKFMKSFKCITCEKSFITKQALRGHESSPAHKQRLGKGINPYNSYNV